MSGHAAGDPAHTEFVPDGGVRLSTETQHVPDLPRFGRYRALAPLGAGGMGTVYRAEDEALGRPVAIKVLHAHGDPGARERFLREARAFGAVPHSNILAIYDAGTAGETPYLVMELAPGGSLRDRLKAGRIEVESVRRLGIQIARALAAAHAAGILHRDIKPGNILAVESERWKLADFGIARLPDSQLTVVGQFLGSPSYAAPESLRAGEFSPASDVYGLGATLYEALAGAPPHGDHDMSSLLRKLEAPPPPLSEQCAVPPSLESAIMAAVALDPAHRPSAEELANRLAAIEDTLVGAVVAAPGAAPVGVLGAAPVSRSRRRLIIGALIGAAVLAIAILAGGGSSPTASGARAPQLQGGSPRGSAGEPGAAGDADRSGEPSEPGTRYEDQYGNPLDEETARRLLEQQREQPRGRGRGRGKKHKNRD